MSGLVQNFHFQSDLDGPDEKLRRSVSALCGADAIILNDYNGSDKITGAVSTEPTGAVNIEWLARDGRFKLELNIWGPGIALHWTAAQFARALAKALARPLLFGDCSAFPFSYFMADADGAIWADIVTIGDEDCFDLLSEQPSSPDFVERRLIFGGHEALPQKPAGDGATLPAERKTNCNTAKDGALCEVFWCPCPMRRLRDTSHIPQD